MSSIVFPLGFVSLYIPRTLNQYWPSYIWVLGVHVIVYRDDILLLVEATQLLEDQVSPLQL